MKKLLIILGIIIIPFYEIFLKALPFVVSVAPDARCTKEIIAMVFALSIGLLAVFRGEIKPFRNKWLLLIPVYLLFNLIMAPHSDLFINNVEVGDFYFWQPFAEVLCFGLMIIAISSMEIQFDEVFRVMVICSTVMAGYVVLQGLGLDQFWYVKQGQQFETVRGRVLGGNMGQPTLVASWMVMMVPLAIYIKKYWMAGLIVVACLMTKGAMVAMALGLIFIMIIVYLSQGYGKFIIAWLVSLALLALFVVAVNPKIRNQAISRMDGRYEVWTNMVKDIRNGQIEDGHKYPITGIGFGRFPFIFPDKHKLQFMQAHNDTLEFIYNCGLIGGFLLLAGIFVMIKGIEITPLSFSVIMSFVAVFFCSLGSFPFQLGAHQFYSAILVGILNGEDFKRRVA